MLMQGFCEHDSYLKFGSHNIIVFSAHNTGEITITRYTFCSGADVMPNTRKRCYTTSRHETEESNTGGNNGLSHHSTRHHTLESVKRCTSFPSLNDVTKVKNEIVGLEKRREENLKANAAFLAALNINEAKTGLATAVKPKSKPTKSALSRRGISSSLVKEEETREPINLRPSDTLRSRNNRLNALGEIEIADESEKRSHSVRLPRSRRPISSNGVSAPNTNLRDQENKYEEQLTEPVLEFKDICKNPDPSECGALRDVASADFVTMKPESRALSDLVKSSKKLRISESLVAKVTIRRITSMAARELSNQRPLVAAGDKWGHVGVWDVLSPEGTKNDGVTLFRPHTQHVNCIKFCPYNAARVYSSSNDGTVRLCDLQAQTFSLVYNKCEPDECRMFYMGFPEPHILSIARYDGAVSFVDQRSDSSNTYELTSVNHQCIKCISHHPTRPHYFITSSRNRLDLWDRRYLKASGNSCVMNDQSASRVISSAYFSPITGNRILTSASDDTIRIYDSSDLTTLPQHCAIGHNNHTGRWLTAFRAEWHPRREDCFLMGAMKHPRRIEMWSADGDLLHQFMDNEELLASVCCLNIFLGTRDMVVGGNSSGRVYIFM